MIVQKLKTTAAELLSPHPYSINDRTKCLSFKLQLIVEMQTLTEIIIELKIKPNRKRSGRDHSLFIF